MKPLKILHVASECVPFAKTGGLADVVGALPIALSELGHDVRVILPGYGEALKKTVTTGKSWPLRILTGEGIESGTILETPPINGVRFYLIDNPEYFDRKYLYGTPEGDYKDNLDRFTFFCIALLESLPVIGFQPDIIHCHDWQTGLIPLYLNETYSDQKYFAATHTVYTIHNLAYQGTFPAAEFSGLGIPESYFDVDGIEYYGKINLMKGGILYSDRITTVSRKYSMEIQTPEYGCGLEGVLGMRKKDLTGIVNGIDYSLWDPETDGYIPSNYSEENLDGKKKCKTALLKKYGIDSGVDRPVIGMISRLADQKGFDLLAEIFDSLMALDIIFVLLGTGDALYHDLFKKFQLKYKGQAGITIDFNNELAHQIEAGADLFLMPSRYEPCGLNQLISLKYGTVPLVRATGGLDDTITDFDEDPARGNGFKFETYSSAALFQKIESALEVYKDARTWKILQKRGMLQDFSWTFSAKQYAGIYNKLTAL